MGHLLGESSALSKQSNCTSKCHRLQAKCPKRDLLHRGVQMNHHATSPARGKRAPLASPTGGKTCLYTNHSPFHLIFPKFHLEMQQFSKNFLEHSLAWKSAHSKTILSLIFSQGNLCWQERPWGHQCSGPHFYLVFLTVLINLKYVTGNLFWSQRFAENTRELSQILKRTDKKK